MENSQPDTTTQLLIIGAGPYGLAMAAWAQDNGLDFRVVGYPMQFWKEHMPVGMLLRSGIGWHMDPAKTHTLSRFAAENGVELERGMPIALGTFIDYGIWFQQNRAIDVLEQTVARLDRSAEHFVATLDSGDSIAASNVVLAVGVRNFDHSPDEYVRMIPPACLSHTCDVVNPADYRGKRVLIVGGRQSAFETAALLCEAGAANVELTYRHDTPRFETSDWSWVPDLVERSVADPGWFAWLPENEQQKIQQRFWSEGRLKLDPWLEPRIENDRIQLHPHSHPVTCESAASGGLAVRLSNDTVSVPDSVILATGYRVDIGRIPLLSAGNLFNTLETDDGYPQLDDHFQTTVPGLFITSLAATHHFGPFFGFVVGSAASARIIGAGLKNRISP